MPAFPEFSYDSKSASWSITISSAESDTDLAAAVVRERATVGGDSVDFHTGIILGSGLGAFGQHLIDHGGIAVPYPALSGMPHTAVAGHAGRLVIGTGPYGGIIVLQGRVHFYEGHDLAAVTYGVRLLQRLGIRRLVVTNAAGGIHPGFRPGDLMIIDGHWSWLTLQQKAFGPHFRSSDDCLWNPAMRSLAASVKTPLNVHSGTYAMMSGPCYETPAEVRMLAGLGVSAVGMSTVPEGLAAASAGLPVVGVSCITNAASGLSDAPLDHGEVSETAARVETDFTAWMLEVVGRLTAMHVG